MFKILCSCGLSTTSLSFVHLFNKLDTTSLSVWSFLEHWTFRPFSDDDIHSIVFQYIISSRPLDKLNVLLEFQPALSLRMVSDIAFPNIGRARALVYKYYWKCVIKGYVRLIRLITLKQRSFKEKYLDPERGLFMTQAATTHQGKFAPQCKRPRLHL